jgi:hypothetical protein
VSQSQYDQVVALSSNVVATVEVPQYYERVIVTNETAANVYVCTNGSAVSTSEGGFGAIVVAGSWRMIGNDQPKEPLVSTTAPGSTVQNTGWQGATDVNLNEPASGYPTYVSLLGADAGNVALEFV